MSSKSVSDLPWIVVPHEITKINESLHFGWSSLLWTARSILVAESYDSIAINIAEYGVETRFGLADQIHGGADLISYNGLRGALTLMMPGPASIIDQMTPPSRTGRMTCLAVYPDVTAILPYETFSGDFCLSLAIAEHAVKIVFDRTPTSAEFARARQRLRAYFPAADAVLKSYEVSGNVIPINSAALLLRSSCF
jgi:hypothetical protein